MAKAAASLALGIRPVAAIAPHAVGYIFSWCRGAWRDCHVEGCAVNACSEPVNTSKRAKAYVPTS